MTNFTKLLRNENLSAAEMMEALYTEAVQNVHAEIFCEELDKGADPGDASEVADQAILNL